jgi:hypothetical protein
MRAIFTYANIRLIEPFCKGIKKDAGYEFLDISESIRALAGDGVNPFIKRASQTTIFASRKLQNRKVYIH